MMNMPDQTNQHGEHVVSGDIRSNLHFPITPVLVD